MFSSQVKLLITNNAFRIVQRETAQSRTGIFRDYGVAKAPPGFQAMFLRAPKAADAGLMRLSASASEVRN
jgi:hypothetical protein